MTNFAIIIIGDEILSGKRADKHLPKAIELLGARGLQLAYADYVGDDKARITATLARAFAAARESGDVRPAVRWLWAGVCRHVCRTGFHRR